MRNIVFIISLPRSGSTLLQRLLSNHPKIFTVPEPWILLNYFSLVNDNITCCCNYSYKVSKVAFTELLKFLDIETYYKIISKHVYELYNEILEKNKKDAIYFIDKTPRYYLILDEINKAFPESKKIFIVRNPLASLISSMNTWKKGRLYLLADYIDYVKGPMLIHNFLKKNKNEKNIMIVKYEHLLMNPKDELKKICNFLDIHYIENLLYLKENDVLKTAKVGDPTGSRKFRELNIDNTNRWIEFIDSFSKKKFFLKYLQTIGKEPIEETFLENFDNLLTKIKSKKIRFNPYRELVDLTYINGSKIIQRYFPFYKCATVLKNKCKNEIIW